MRVGSCVSPGSATPGCPRHGVHVHVAGVCVWWVPSLCCACARVHVYVRVGAVHGT